MSKKITLQIPEAIPEDEVVKIKGFFQRYLDSAAADISEGIKNDKKPLPLTPEAA